MAKNKWLYWLEELGKDDGDIAGRKSANLGEMLRAKVRVPLGFAISANEYARFLQESGILTEIEDYFHKTGAEFKNYGNYVEAAQYIQDLFKNREMPEDMQTTIIEYYRALGEKYDTTEVPVAVRSSGRVSMPGQFETYLNIRGEEDLLQNIVRCWGSTFTTQAIATRHQRGLPLTSFPIGITILKMVNARVAGVAFSVNPTNNNSQQIVLEGTWGLGETVVGGTVAPDRFLVEKSTINVLEQSINKKEKAMVYGVKGTYMQDVPLEERDKPCLTGEELAELCRMVTNVEQHFGVPQDVEWAIDREIVFPENIFLVQTRPVTTINAKKDQTIDYITNLMVQRVFHAKGY